MQERFSEACAAVLRFAPVSRSLNLVSRTAPSENELGLRTIITTSLEVPATGLPVLAGRLDATIRVFLVCFEGGCVEETAACFGRLKQYFLFIVVGRKVSECYGIDGAQLVPYGITAFLMIDKTRAFGHVTKIDESKDLTVSQRDYNFQGGNYGDSTYLVESICDDVAIVR
ncbi:hypothetical protein CRM22_008254 [Opisthorchis felineus]|uniref:Uncharacterized protein n=1 Tax=Opisthorchis felineus TaxID=147828 RepID=A0A4S2LCJ4_OPIFE|nr:hypothetical protein CRM22_008254 [Opisthorchis felineus]